MSLGSEGIIVRGSVVVIMSISILVGEKVSFKESCELELLSGMGYGVGIVVSKEWVSRNF